jgi:hypothetical protein
MRKFLTAAAVMVGLGAGTAHAATKTFHDATGDFLASFAGDINDSSLDIKDFTVDFSDPFATFLLDVTLAGPLVNGDAGFYVLGIDTGAGANHPFGTIGEGNVLFDQVVVIQKDGSAKLGAVSLTATPEANGFRLAIPVSLLPSTGRAAVDFGFNLWSRDTSKGLGSIADFAPDNALLSLGVPEPTGWALMISGFGLAGATLRGRRKSAAARLA